MRTDEFRRAGIDDSAVPTNVIVIADAAEAATAMDSFQFFCREGTVCPGGAAMHHNQIDTSHGLNEFFKMNSLASLRLVSDSFFRLKTERRRHTVFI